MALVLSSSRLRLTTAKYFGRWWAAGAGSGTVTTLTAGSGITLNPNPTIVAGTVSLTAPVSIANGGTGAIVKATAFNNLSPMTTLGDVIYGAAAGAGTRLPGNTTTTRKFMRQVGDSVNSAAPAWDTLVQADFPNATDVINVKAYGAKGDGKYTTAAINIGSPTVTFSTAALTGTSEDLYKIVTIAAAGNVTAFAVGSFTNGSKSVTGIPGVPPANSLVGKTLFVNNVAYEIADNTTITLYLRTAFADVTNVYAFTVHDHLVTYIAGFTAGNFTTCTLHDANASGRNLTGMRAAVGTDDTAAFQSAVTVAQTYSDAGAGEIYVPGGRYMIGTTVPVPGNPVVYATLDMDGAACNGITITGVGTETSGGNTGSGLIFTKPSGNCFQSRGNSGVRLRQISFRVENSAFAGNVIAIGADAASDTSLFSYEFGDVDGGGGGDCTLVDCTPATTKNCIEASLRRLNFIYGKTALAGASKIQVGLIEECQFVNQRTYPIMDPAQAFSVQSCTFEQTCLDTAAAISSVADISGLSYRGNWHGDASSTAAGQRLMSIRVVGGDISGNYFGSIAQNITGIYLTNTCYGLSISGNRFDFNTAGSVGIDGGGFSHRSLTLGPNYIDVPTRTQNANAGEIVGFNNTANSPATRFGIGTAVPDITGDYGNAIAVTEVRSGHNVPNGYGVIQTSTGSLADASGVTIGLYETTYGQNTAGAANKHLVQLESQTQGTTANGRGGKLIIRTRPDGGGGTPSSGVVINNKQYVGLNINEPVYPFHVYRSEGAVGNQTAARVQYTATAADAFGKWGVVADMTASHAAGTLNNVYGFQSAISLTGNGGTTTNLFGLYSSMALSAGAIATTAYHLRLTDATGAGAVTNQYGLYVDAMTKGAMLNYAIYTAGSAASRFGGQISLEGDVFLTRRAAANLTLGAADAVAPVSQSLSTQGSRAGTDANVGGGNLTVVSGLGTGTGAPSFLALQVPIGVGAGSGIQSATTVLQFTGALQNAIPIGTTTNSWLQLTRGRKRMVTSPTNGTVNFANLADLTVTLEAARNYTGRMVIYASDSTAADGIKFDFNGGTATMTSFEAYAMTSASTPPTIGALESTSLAGVINWTSTGITGNVLYVFEISMVVNAAGTFIPRFAQDAHTVGTATVLLGSFLHLDDSAN